MRAKLHLSGRFGLFSRRYPCSPLNTDGDSSVACSLLTSSPPFLFPSTPLPLSLKSLSASRSPVPYRALIRQFILFLWAPSSICGCDSQSPRRGSIPSRDLDTQLRQHCSIIPLFPLSHVNFSHVRHSVITSCHSLMRARLRLTQL